MAGTEHVVESKVVASSVWAALAAGAIAVLNAAVADSALLGALPPWMQAVVLVAVPPLVTFLGGYAKRSNRV